MKIDIRDRIAGAIYGVALGDAMGMPAYFFPDQTREKFGWIEDFLDAPSDHPVHKGFVAGQITDDTEQTLAIAQAIIDEGKVTLEGIAKALLNWYESVGGDDSSYVGPSTKAAMKRIKAGEDLMTTGITGTTNGAVMRISPIGLIHPGDRDRAFHDAVISCIPTHNTNVAISGASAVAVGISRALVSSNWDDILLDMEWGAKEGAKRGNKYILPSIEERFYFVYSLAETYKDIKQTLEIFYNIVGTGLQVYEIVPSALGMLILAEGDPLKTAIYSANCSGDADTLGAIACGLAGAANGASSIPSYYIKKIQEVNEKYDFEGIIDGLTDLALRNMS